MKKTFMMMVASMMMMTGVANASNANSNLCSAHRILDARQYHDYVKLMNLTLINTGLVDIYNNANAEK